MELTAFGRPTVPVTRHGASPHGSSYDGPDWMDAAVLPGSANLGVAKKLLERFEWWRFEPHPEWIEQDDCAFCEGFYNPKVRHYFVPRAAGIPGDVRIIYFYPFLFTSWPKAVLGLEPGTTYRAFFFNPSTGEEHDLGCVAAGDGRWPIPNVPVARDWLLVLTSQ